MKCVLEAESIILSIFLNRDANPVLALCHHLISPPRQLHVAAVPNFRKSNVRQRQTRDLIIYRFIWILNSHVNEKNLEVFHTFVWVLRFSYKEIPRTFADIKLIIHTCITVIALWLFFCGLGTAVYLNHQHCFLESKCN